MNFYTNVALDGNNILYRGIVDGKRVQKRIHYKPKLYLKSQLPNTKNKTLQGETLDEKIFSSIYEARTFVKKYKDVDGFDIYGNQRYQYAFIADMFPDLAEVDASFVNVAFIDIEVNSSNGLPDPMKADEPITAITFEVGEKKYVFGFGEFDTNDPNIFYRQFDTESEMLREFLLVWMEAQIDIVSGWNIKTFDIPYLINRCILVLGHEATLDISPWKQFEAEMEDSGFGNNQNQIYKIAGISVLDYIDMYRKYSPTPNQESYSLENISSVELNEHKVDYETLGYSNLEVLREKNHQLFIEYNIQDVNLVRRIDDKLRLIELVITLATRNHVNYEDVFYQVRMWDSIVHNKLQIRNIVLPPSSVHSKTNQYVGAYVKQTVPGRYRYLSSFDLTSLYPKLIMMYNISPETLVTPDQYDEEMIEFKRLNVVNVDGLLNERFNLEFLKKRKLTMTPNGQFFRTDIRGFMPQLMEEMFAARKSYKDQQLQSERLMDGESDSDKKADYKKQISRFKALQSAFKVTLNSAYGALGSPWFRLFDVRIAEAITMAGQLSVRWIQQDINKYFNQILQTNDDYVIGSDTDSIYVSMDYLVNKFMKDTSDRPKVVDFMNKVCEEKIKPFIGKSYDRLSNYVNAYAQEMVMKRENIMDQAIWIGKKHYIVSVCIDEAGVNHSNKPEIKITGLEAIKSSTPKLCRTRMKEFIEIMLNGTEEQAIVFNDKFREEFKQRPIKEIAFPRGVTNLSSYIDPSHTFVKGTPIQVRAALQFNTFLAKHGLDRTIEKVKERDKIKWVYLKEPNPFQSNVMGFINKIPKEMELERYVDYDTQFEKTFKSPVQGWLNVIGWQLDKEDDLASFFG